MTEWVHRQLAFEAWVRGLAEHEEEPSLDSENAYDETEPELTAAAGH